LKNREDGEMENGKRGVRELAAPAASFLAG